VSITADGTPVNETPYRTVEALTMKTRTRYFVIVSLLVLAIGLGTGLVAYYAGFPMGATQGGPDELTLVPRDAVLVAYADVHAVMVSVVQKPSCGVPRASSSLPSMFEAWRRPVGRWNAKLYIVVS